MSNRHPKCRTLLITSCKGGIGKSTVAANLGATIAHKGKRVLLIDCDFGSRCLDLILGCENEIVYDMGDVIADPVSAQKAIFRFPDEENLMFCAAPAALTDIGTEELASTISALIEAAEADFAILDTAGGLSIPLGLPADLIDTAIIVASHQPVSLRAAEKTAALLTGNEIADLKLVVNSFDFSSAKDGSRAGILEMIDRSHIPLLGLIPHDEALFHAQEQGLRITELTKNDLSAPAFSNLADRLMGLQVPILRGLRYYRRRNDYL